jgi:amino acid adenylation domain-containing protein
LTASQRQQVLYEWNDTGAEFPNTCAHELFEQQVARDPDAIAVIGGGKSLSYRELNERANQVAHYLRKLGVGTESLVGVCLHRSPEMVVGLLGVWKSGAAYVPLDSSYPEDRLTFMVSDAAVQVLLTEESCRHLFPLMQEKTVCLDSDWAAIAKEDDSNLDSGATPSNLAYVMYTSGSTGKPKGAMILHRGLVNYLWWAVRTYDLKAGGSVPVHSSISFDLTVTSLYPALVSGGQVELLAEDVGAQNLLAALRRRKDRNLVKITPAHLEALGLQLSAEEVENMTRVFVIGGENLLAESLRLWRDSSPDTRLINEYGPTETVVGCCVYEVQADDPQNGSVPIGRPIANTQLYILDEKLEPVALGAMGELYIGGAGVARGYLNRPDLTQERFLPDPFSRELSGKSDARMYKTGDLARYREDGIIEYLGRVDNQVKVRGYRIELGEIEAVLASAPAVQSCAVLAREDTPGDKQLVGYVVSRGGKPPAVEELQSYLKDRLPEYMVPAKFVFLDSFPLTHNGKVDRKALPAPVNEEKRPAADSAQPRTATEEAIAAIWMEMFKIDHVGIHDDFFDLGGHSLLAIKVMSRIRDVIGVDLPVLNLFENPTIAALAADVAKAGGAIAPADVAPTEAAKAPVERQAPQTREAPAQKEQETRKTAAPFYFGAADSALFGVYAPPSGSVTRQAVVLMCAPIGAEYMRTHYAVRLVSTQLARAGFHTLRFDYHGTGDSSGNVETGQFDRWTDDIALAARELIERSGVRDLTVVGLRMGAALAVEALASRNIKAQGLVLWDPVVSGGDYLATMEKLNSEVAAERNAPLRPTDELFGFRFPQDLRTKIHGLELTDRLRKVDVKNAALIVSEDLPQYGALLSEMRSRGLEARFSVVGEPVGWNNLKKAFEGRLTGPIVRAVAEAVESLS